MNYVVPMVFFVAAWPVGVQIALWTALGAICLKVVESWLGKHTEQANDKKDYRDEIKELRERVDSLEDKVEEWRDRYFSEQQEVATLRTVLINNGMVPPPRGTTPAKE